MSYDFIFNISEIMLIAGAIGIEISAHYNINKRIDSLFEIVSNFMRRR